MATELTQVWGIACSARIGWGRRRSGRSGRRPGSGRPDRAARPSAFAPQGSGPRDPVVRHTSWGASSCWRKSRRSSGPRPATGGAACPLRLACSSGRAALAWQPPRVARPGI